MSILIGEDNPVNALVLDRGPRYSTHFGLYEDCAGNIEALQTYEMVRRVIRFGQYI